METTLAQARQELHRQLANGPICPCCDQQAQLYERKLDRGLARLLQSIHVAYGGSTDWFHLRAHMERHKLDVTNYSLLRYWSLLLPMDPDTSHKDKSGKWRMPEKGHEFVLNRLDVPRFAYTYNAELVKFSDEMTNIQTALGDEWVYKEMKPGSSESLAA